jgi:hypothetical protein
MAYEGPMAQARLARLGAEDQHLVEQIVLASGNLKEVAGVLQISYPTLRKRLDGLIESLRSLRRQDEADTRNLLDQVEHGTLRPEAAARRIRELNGG